MAEPTPPMDDNRASSAMREFSALGGSVDMFYEWWPGELYDDADGLLTANDARSVLYLNPRVDHNGAGRLVAQANLRLRRLRELGPELDGWTSYQGGWQLRLRVGRWVQPLRYGDEES
ncbi:MAG: hypothetical protein WCA46_10590 [Actinocatenispora sp.]